MSYVLGWIAIYTVYSRQWQEERLEKQAAQQLQTVPEMAELGDGVPQQAQLSKSRRLSKLLSRASARRELRRDSNISRASSTSSLQTKEAR